MNGRVNQLIQRCADDRNVVYLDVGPSLMDAEGRVSNQVLFDYLHPTMVGYGILAGGIDAQVGRMLADKAGSARPRP